MKSLAASFAFFVLLSAAAGLIAADDSVAVEYPTSVQWGPYKRDLNAAILRADRIVVSEHSSFPHDFDSGDGKRPAARDPIVYGRRELDQSQITEFLAAVRAMSNTTPNIYLACAFEHHHTIEFFANDALSSTMQICFTCGDVYWDGTKATVPNALTSVLAAVIRDAGFATERDWRELARQQP